MGGHVRIVLTTCAPEDTAFDEIYRSLRVRHRICVVVATDTKAAVAGAEWATRERPGVLLGKRGERG